jgi:hypothetical protein
LSEKNLTALSKAIDRFWDAGRPVNGRSTNGRGRAAKANGSSRDPKEIRAWALANGVAVPSRGRIPATVESLYNESNGH